MLRLPDNLPIPFKCWELRLPYGFSEILLLDLPLSGEKPYNGNYAKIMKTIQFKAQVDRKFTLIRNTI